MSESTFNTRMLYYVLNKDDNTEDDYITEDESDGVGSSSVDGDDGSGISSNLTIEASIALNAKPGDVGVGKGADGGDVSLTNDEKIKKITKLIKEKIKTHWNSNNGAIDLPDFIKMKTNDDFNDVINAWNDSHTDNFIYCIINSLGNTNLETKTYEEVIKLFNTNYDNYMSAINQPIMWSDDGMRFIIKILYGIPGRDHSSCCYVKRLGLELLEVFKTVQDANLVIAYGSVVKFQGDAIVNAANERCLGGGGVDGAIGKAGGDSLYAARNGLPIQIKGTEIRCRTGTAEITSAPVNETFGSLEARHVIHAVGPVYKDEPPYDDDADELLKNAYKNSLKEAAENKDDIKTIAFSLLSSSRFAGGRGKKDVIKMGIESINTNAKPNTTIYMVAYPESSRPYNEKYEELINLLKATEEAKFTIKSSKIKKLLKKYKDKEVQATHSDDIEKILKGE